MKVAITGYDHRDGLARNLLVTFRNMGHDPVYIGDLPWLQYETPVRRFIALLLLRHPRFEATRSERIARNVISARPDLFISLWTYLRPEAVKEIRDAGIKAVFLYPDYLGNLDRQYPLLAPYHLLFFKDPYMVRVFREKAGIPAHYLPEACNPMWHRPVELTESERSRYECDVTTASNMYPYRLRVMESLGSEYDIKLWGPPWPVWLNSGLSRYWAGSDVRELEKAKAFIGARIVLNVMHYGEIEGVNCRTFEAAGCGAFQIADWKPALPELFEPDKEIVTFTNREELKDKVDYYLRHAATRKQIAEAGQMRAHRDHTYENRICDILTLVGKLG